MITRDHFPTNGGGGEGVLIYLTSFTFLFAAHYKELQSFQNIIFTSRSQRPDLSIEK